MRVQLALLYLDIKAPLSQHPPSRHRSDTESSYIEMISKKDLLRREVCTSYYISPQSENIKRVIVDIVDSVQANDAGKQGPCSEPACRSSPVGLRCMRNSCVLKGFDGLKETQDSCLW